MKMENYKQYLLKKFSQMLNIEISKLAQKEIEESKEYYNLQRKNFGLDFKNDILKAINSISTHPTLYPVVATKIRRCLLHKFPFSIFYTIKNETIIILSVAHQHRKPKYT